MSSGVVVSVVSSPANALAVCVTPAAHVWALSLSLGALFSLALSLCLSLSRPCCGAAPGVATPSPITHIHLCICTAPVR